MLLIKEIIKYVCILSLKEISPPPFLGQLINISFDFFPLVVSAHFLFYIKVPFRIVQALPFMFYPG